VGGATRRPASSGTLVSLKYEFTGGSSVTRYYTGRPDGCADIIANFPGGQNGTATDVVCVYDSTVVTYDGNPNWGLRFPSANPYIGVTFNRWRIVDTATSPVHFPVDNMYGSNSNVKFQNFTIHQHVKTGPFPALNGTGISSDMSLYIDSCSGGRPAGGTNNPGTVYGC
jgi:hypothetical protein